MTYSLRVFFIGGLISYRALFGWMSPWVFIPTLLVAPIFQILLFVFIGRAAEIESDSFYVVGNALQYASVPCVAAMTQTIAGERVQRTLGYILISPAGRIPLFVGRSLPVVLNGAFISAFALITGAALLDVHLPLGSLPALALLVLLAAFSCAGIGLITAGIGMRVRETSVLNNVVFGILLVLSGANVSLGNLPSSLATFSHALPLTHAIEAARRVVAGETFRAVDELVAAEAGIGLAYALSGYALIRVMERLSRTHATLERA